MATMNISLSDSLLQFLKEQVDEHGYSSVSEYLRELLRAAKRRVPYEKLDSLLLAGLASPAKKMTEEDWKKIRSTVSKRLSSRK